MTRISKRQRRVALAEAALVVQRGVLRTEFARLRDDARRAATPGRIVSAGALLGGLVGLLQGGRHRAPEAPAATGGGGGSLRTLIQVFRLVSMAMPMIAPLMRMAGEAADDDGGNPDAGPVDDMAAP